MSGKERKSSAPPRYCEAFKAGAVKTGILLLYEIAGGNEHPAVAASWVQ